MCLRRIGIAFKNFCFNSLLLLPIIFIFQAFHDFCLNHELIEVMKLRYGGGQTGMGKATPLEWNSETWRNLPKLRILSLEANLIGIFHYQVI